MMSGLRESLICVIDEERCLMAPCERVMSFIMCVACAWVSAIVNVILLSAKVDGE